MARVRSARPRDRHRLARTSQNRQADRSLHRLEVDPDTGIRDLPIPQTLLQNFGHMDCGIYGEVVAGAPIAVGDHVAPIDA